MFKSHVFFVLLSSGLVATATAYAEEMAKLEVPEIIQILSIDGQEQQGNFFGSKQHTRSLPVGEHVLSVRYSQLFSISSEDHDILKSKPMAIRFVAEAGKTYQLAANPPKRYEAAKEFAKQPDIKLIDKTTGTTQQAIAVKSYAEASLVDTIGKAFQNTEERTPLPQSNNTQLLQDIWLRATPQERQAFAAWLASQAANSK